MTRLLESQSSDLSSISRRCTRAFKLPLTHSLTHSLSFSLPLTLLLSLPLFLSPSLTSSPPASIECFPATFPRFQAPGRDRNPKHSTRKHPTQIRFRLDGSDNLEDWTPVGSPAFTNFGTRNLLDFELFKFDMPTERGRRVRTRIPIPLCLFHRPN